MNKQRKNSQYDVDEPIYSFSPIHRDRISNKIGKKERKKEDKS